MAHDEGPAVPIESIRSEPSSSTNDSSSSTEQSFDGGHGRGDFGGKLEAFRGSPFGMLPKELVLFIFEFVDYKGLGSLAGVCRLWADIIRTDVIASTSSAKRVQEALLRVANGVHLQIKEIAVRLG